MKRSLIFITLLLLVLPLLLSIGFSSTPSINNDVRTKTGDDLVCRWENDTAAINVTVEWFVDGALNRSATYLAPIPVNSTVVAADTVRDQGWTCRVTLFNATDNATAEDNVTIENADPVTPTAYNSTGGIINSKMNITEDSVFTIDLNSSDDDNDTLTYFLLEAKFCTITNSSEGLVSCNATHSWLDTNASGAENDTEVAVDFWVRDVPPNTKSSSKGITFNITPVNDAPNVTIPDQTTQLNVTFNETFTIEDEEGDFPVNATLVVPLTSANISGDVTVSVEGGNTLRVVYGTSPLEPEDVGNQTITINLTDEQNASQLFNFTLEITDINRAPYFIEVSPENYSSPLNRTYVLDQDENITINFIASDLDASTRSQTLTFNDNSTKFTTTPVLVIANSTQNATAYINYTALNAHVGSHTILVTVTDQGGFSDNLALNFTINNVNDPPLLYNYSYDSGNTGGNENLTHLVAYLDAPFRYQINFSDPDLDIGYDTITFDQNATTFNVTDSGFINFTPSGVARNETIKITITDFAGENDSRSIQLEIKPNTPPYFNESFPDQNCSEDLPCFFNVNFYAKEDNPGDNVSLYTGSSVGGTLNSFAINATTGVINFTPTQSEIGNHTINITITDTRGATAWALLNISINNTKDTPVWEAYLFNQSVIVEDHEFSYLLEASDEDVLLGDNLTFEANLSWMTISFQERINDTIRALLFFTPNSSHLGAQSVLLNVTDTTGRNSSVVVNFTVIADTNAPTIDYIQPYGGVNDVLVEAYLDVSGYSVNEENVTISENTSGLTFEVNASDETPPAQLSYSWYYDGVSNGSGTGTSWKSKSFSFGFQSNGTHNLTVLVNDTALETTRWTWLLNITDINRAPQFITNYTDNISIDSTTTIPDYLSVYNGTHFYDPDDDTDGNGSIDSGETNRLSYEATSCSHATLEFIGDNLKLTPVSVGTCTVTFNATDSGGLTAESNLVTITVTEVPQGAQTTSVSSGGGGGGVTTQNTLIPIQQEIESPKPLTIIAPRMVTIYQNETIEVPIELHNNWTEALENIILKAESNTSGVEMRFDSNLVEELPVNGTHEVMLTVSGYRFGENFEVRVTANVTKPSFQDTALILFNSIEQSQEGEDVEVKVTFAQDLLSEHDECQELNELLKEAQLQFSQGDVQTAGQMVDVVINGCKYLISKTQVEQQPSIIRTPWLELDDGQLRIISFTALAVLIALSLVGLLYHHHKTKNEYDF